MNSPQVGDVIGPTRYVPTLTGLVMFAAAMWEFQRIHFDAAWAKHEGFDAPIVHGPLLGTYLAQTVRRWAGSGGRLRTIGWRNERVAYVDQPLEVSGHVIEIARDAVGAWECECRLAIHAIDGPRVLSGHAMVTDA